MSDGNDKSAKGTPIRVPGREADTRVLPRRFYKDVAVGPSTGGSGYTILLDGRAARTPGKRILELPSRSLADAVAAEWAAVGTAIDPATMPLTRLVNTAIDGVAERMGEVAADVVKYAGSDLVCYRADFPVGLVERQRVLWDPVLAWLLAAYDAAFVTVTGVRHVAQPPQALDAIAAAVGRLDSLRLTSTHVITTLTGSAILALAVMEGHLTPEAAWAAANVDEDWQIAEWGEDAEASRRRANRWQEMQAASALARLAGP